MAQVRNEVRNGVRVDLIDAALRGPPHLPSLGVGRSTGNRRGTLLRIALGCCPWQRRAVIGQAVRAAVLRLDIRKFGTKRPRPVLQVLVLRGLLLRRLRTLIDRALFFAQRRSTV